MSNTTFMNDRDLRNYRRKRKRQREVRRIFVLAGIAVVLVLGFARSYHALLSRANTEIENISYKYFTSIQVEPGDTLWSLADKYADQEHYASRDQYIAEVMAMNHMSGDELSTGSYLILPYYSPEFIK